ncbi:MAG TPA: hypothetical protein VF581_01225 [Flavobacterium sp.]
MSLVLWQSDRAFPVLSPFSADIEIPSEVHLLLLSLSLLALTLTIINPKKPFFIAAVIIFEMLSCSLDLMRWQPWEFQYLLTFLLFIGCKENDQKFIRLFALIFIASYIFAGLHKISGSFLHSIWDRLILYRGFGLPGEIRTQPLIHYSGLLIGLTEITIGLGLLLALKKKPFALSAVTMHVVVAMMLSPLFLNHNSIVLPWNLAMALMVWLVFGSEVNFSDVRSWKSKPAMATLLFIGILPLLNFIGKWDNYLSFNLYSADIQRLMICLPENVVHPDSQRYFSNKKASEYCGGSHAINVDKWALDELNVPVFPEQRAFVRFKEQWQKKYPDSDATFVTYSYPYKSGNIRKI